MSVLKDCAKNKILGPDRWMVEFFLSFWDIMGKDVLEMVEESKKYGLVSKALNSTFIALLPKKTKLDTFNDFKPISLCNLAYKIISKIISERLKPILANVISLEKFGFLHNRKILDAVVIKQEGLHLIKTKNISALILL